MKILCVGRNYVKHAEELGNEVPDEPVIFMKPDSALMRQRDAFYIPDWTNEVHYEAELVVRFMRLGKNIEARFAPKYYQEITVGLDFTARDVQSQLKSKGLPWEKAKAFDQSAVLGNWVDISELKNREEISFQLFKNGELVQDGNSKFMINSIPQLVEHCSSYFTIKIGDLLFTGTPQGVGPVKAGDVLEAFLEGEKLLHVRIK